MRFAPKLLLIFDIYENHAYELECELRQKYGEGNVEVEPLPKNTTSPCLVLDPHPAAQATGQGTGEVVNLEEELDL